ncbi:efflux transporter outer membrane subunit [Azohydromonas aeria]|uniref:efflux transporter outer membrane subunit n=1 Tax=Azohydromonas aeria TaxID=2590212 RepID=UPI0012FA2F42|nr:efflux transporter outer membrane subunit [Azohydromonas aeria]
MPSRCGCGRALPALLLALAATGCAWRAGPDYRAPEAELPPRYGPAADCAAPAAAVPWWRGFGEPALDALVAQARARNLEISAAAARIDEARALLRVAEAGRRPEVSGEAGLSRQQRLAGSGGGGSSGSGEAGGGDSRTGAAASLLLAWSPDLFGGRAREVEAAGAELRRRQALGADLERVVVAEVVRAYLALRLARAEQALLDEALRTQERTVEIVRVRRQAGLASALDLNRSLAEAAATRARLGRLLLAQESARQALALLAGEAAQEPDPAGAAGAAGVPRWDGDAQSSVPLARLRCRPDLAAAEANLARASAEIGVAEAQLRPQLSLPGTLSASAAGLGSGAARAVVAGLSVTLRVPLFDAGGRRALVDAARARAQEALLAYRQTVLAALGEAETALAALEGARLAEAASAQAVQASEQAFVQARVLYREGLTTLLDVLDAQRSLIANREALAGARADAARAVADLHAALGAGTGTVPAEAAP